MCRSSCVYNLLYFVICKDMVEGPVEQNKVLIFVFQKLSLYLEKGKVCHCVTQWRLIGLSWVLLCLLRLLFKMKYLNYLLSFGWLLIFLWRVLYLLPFTVAQALLSEYIYECKDVTQLLCTQANGKLNTPTACGSYVLCGSGSSVVQAGHLV